MANRTIRLGLPKDMPRRAGEQARSSGALKLQFLPISSRKIRFRKATKRGHGRHKSSPPHGRSLEDCIMSNRGQRPRPEALIHREPLSGRQYPLPRGTVFQTGAGRIVRHSIPRAMPSVSQSAVLRTLLRRTDKQEKFLPLRTCTGRKFFGKLFRGIMCVFLPHLLANVKEKL